MKVIKIKAEGNKEEGYDWESYKIVEKEVDYERYSDLGIINYCRSKRYIKKEAQIIIIDDGHNLVITDNKTEEPLFAFVYGDLI
jgi:hypothetical protein